MSTPARFARWDEAELKLCLWLNAAARSSAVQRYFRVVSLIGDGWIWYTLILVPPLLLGAPAVVPALHMAAAGIAGVLVYKTLKRRLVRERPYITHTAIACGTRPLDRYSFPSGHTLHAVCFTVLANHYYPAFGPLLYPFTISVMLSRPVLGLHYPSDVIAGGAIGWVLAVGSLLLVAS